MVVRAWWPLIQVLLIVVFFGPSNAVLNADEENALLIIKNQWITSNFTSWIAGTDPCQNVTSWRGIECDTLGEHVITLNLTGMGVNGSIPEDIRRLTFLKILDASESDRGALTNIEGDLGPLVSLTHLKSLNLSRNHRNGSFPDVIFNLTSLVELKVDNNMYSGNPSLSPRIGNLKNLEKLYLGSNNLVGGFPAEFWFLGNLREISLFENDLGSEIPKTIANLTNLEFLNLHDCKLWGGIPSEIGSLQRLHNLQLYSNSLTGRIPESMQKLTNLNTFRLSQNYFSGKLPEWIWSFQNLTNLQLDKNAFEGSYPALLQQTLTNVQLDCNYLSGTLPVMPLRINNTQKWDVDENCFTGQEIKTRNTQCKWDASNAACTVYFASVANGACPPCPAGQQPYNTTLCTCKPKDEESKSKTTAILIGVIVPVIALLAGIVALGILWKRKKDHAELMTRFNPHLAGELYDPNWQAPAGVQRFKLSELSSATGGFDEAHEIGVGGFGKVFVGNFKDGRTLAIKRASNLVSSTQGMAEFRNEVLLLSRLHHKNLVRLEGFCDESGVQVLVYEFMRQGNLHAHLLRSSKQLDWYKRLEIAVGVAHGLEYLHSYADPPVIHRDVKPSNILLDDNLVAKVADFGISKATDTEATHVSTRPAGTAGYFDPQYFIRQQLTTASDVYGYGVVLLELVTGQKAIDHTRVSNFNLVEWVKEKLKEEGIRAIVDSKLGDDYPEDIYQDMAQLGLECAMFDKDSRPSMKEVVNTLEVHLNNCTPPPPSDYTFNWKSEDSDYSTKASGGASFTSASTSSYVSGKLTDSDFSDKRMSSALLPR